ncbi:hypothetical protein CO641_02170 [Lysobacteraceae bacterium NML91-0213]|nr:hypothetical protein CO641_02170 [Xanthomonadaceae bacterium NML91-0213]
MADVSTILPVLDRWAGAITASDHALDLIQAATGLEPEAPLPQAVYDLQGLADLWAASAVRAGESWFEWYRLENQMGERALRAGVGFEFRPIRTLQDFAELLAAEIRQADAEAADA